MIEITVRSSEQPLPRLRGEWEVTFNGERWFGPDTLWACLEAQRALAPVIRELISPS